MIITKETDYALRLLRALRDGEKHTVSKLSQSEFVPQQFAYKILKKLSKSGMVQIIRGVDGGCQLIADLSKTSLYDVMEAVDENGSLCACMEPEYHCTWCAAHGNCSYHCRLAEIQQRLNDELRSCYIEEILSNASR